MYKRLLQCVLFMLVSINIFGQGLRTFDQLLSHNFTNVDSLALMLLEAQKDYVLKDKGFRLNTAAGSNEFGDLDPGNVFRVRVGFEWNLLDEGLMDRKLSSKLFDIEKSIKEYELKEESFDKNYLYLFNQIIYSFNQEKLKYLEEKSYLLNILIKRYESLYHAHAISYNELINIYDQIEEVKILNLAMYHYNRHFEKMVDNTTPTLNPRYLPILDIKIEDLLAFQFIDTTFQRIKELKLEKNEIQDRLNTQKRLAIYNNTYWRPFLGPNKEKYLYNSVGIRFNTDLVRRSKEKDRVNALHDQIDVKRNEEVIFNNQKELSNFLLEYHSKLRTYSRYAHKLKALIEDKRLESAVQFVNYEAPQSNLKTLNIDLERLIVEYELLEIKQQLYILILKIFKKANISSLLPYVKERIITKDNNKLKGSRLIVLDGNYSKTSEHAFLTEYLAKNEFFDIVLKQDNYTNNDFKTALEIKGFRIYDDPDALSYRNIVNIPLENFNNRIEMEYWIGDNYSGDDNTLYLVNNLNQLLSIDSFTLDD